MEPEDPQLHEGTKEHRAESNVVWLPRDWLGPPEDLVPVKGRHDRGESSTAAQGRPPDASGAPWDENASDGYSLAEGFWGGEGSGAIHEVLRAPVRVDRRRFVAQISHLRPHLAGLADGRLPGIALTRPVVLTLFVVAGVALGAGILTVHGMRAARLAAASGSAASSGPLDRLNADAQVGAMLSVKRHAVGRTLAANGQPARVRRPTGTRSRPKAVRTAPAVAAGFTALSRASTPASASDGSTYASSRPISASATVPATDASSGSAPSVGASTSTAGSGATSATAPPNPSASSARSGVPRPAFGADGTLGPGTSPNS